MVSGYSYPVKWDINESCNVVKQNFEGNIWGVGFWKNEWNELIAFLRKGQLIRQFSSALKANKFEGMTDWAVKDYVKAVVNGTAIHSLLKRVTDVALRIYLSVADKYAVMPVVSKTRNIGFDGTGAFCEVIGYNSEEEETSSNYQFDLQPLDSDSTFVARIDNAFDCDHNRRIANQFDRRPAGEREEMLAKAEVYSKLNELSRFSLNLRANTAKVSEVIKRTLNKC